MKLPKFKFSETISCNFSRLSRWTGYVISLAIVFFVVTEEAPKAMDLMPVAKMLFEAAKISITLEKKSIKTKEE
ncbi:MAG: hypothetical protein AAFV71_08770 [Cyanobacteria bacterium J06633_8]